MLMQKNIRVDLMKDLYKEIPKATTKDLASIIDFLKRAREVRTGKTKKRREARKKYVEKQLDKADLPFWWYLLATNGARFINDWYLQK